MIITEIHFTPIRPKNGLVGFASCVIDGSFYLGSIAIHSRPDGSYRLVYPEKRIGESSMSIFHPINKSAGRSIEKAVIEKCEQIIGKSDEEHMYDGHGAPNL